MKQSLFSLVIFSLFLSSPGYSWNLNDPVSSENAPHWEALSSEFNVCFLQGTARHEDALYFVIESEGRETISLTLDNPEDRLSLSAFFKECEKSLELADRGGGVKRVGVVHSGSSAQGEVREWLKNMVSRHSQASERAAFPLFGASPIQILNNTGEATDQLVIAYTFQLPAPNTLRDMRKLWVIELIQQMTLQRFAKEGLLSTLEGKKDLLPEANFRLKFPAEGGDWAHYLETCLQKIKEIAEIGFTADELLLAKRECLQQVQEMGKDRSSISSAAFHAQTFARGVKAIDYSTFLDVSTGLIESVTPVDIAIVLHECFSQDQRTVSYLASHHVDHSWTLAAQQLIDQAEREGIHKIAFVKTEMAATNLLEQLPLNDHERSLIYKIVDTMARDNVLKLGWKRKTMEKKGKKIRHVHPLRFLDYVFADPHLHNCMREIHHSSFKWNGFIDGMKNRIEEEAARGGLLPYVHDFASHLHVDEGRVRQLIEKRDWDGLVRYLL